MDQLIDTIILYTIENGLLTSYVTSNTVYLFVIRSSRTIQRRRHALAHMRT